MSQMDEINKEIFRHYFYSRKDICYEIIKLSKFKEMVFIDKERARLPVRNMFIYTYDMLKEHFSQFRFFNSPTYNMYLSCAYFKNTPPFSFLPEKRREQMNAWSGVKQEPQYKNHWAGYDFFMDFDSVKEDSIDDAYKDMRKMKAVFDQYQVPYILTFSGGKGYHLRIPYKFLPQSLGLQIVQFCKILGENIKNKLELDTLDIGIFDDRRVFKAPYSYDRGNVCLPLDDEQAENFNISDMKVTNVLQKIKIFNRGDLMRHTNFSLEKQREHFLEFWRAMR